MTIEVNRDGKWVKVNPGELTNAELCDILSDIQIDSDEFISDGEISMWYAAIRKATIREVIDMLNKNEDRRSVENGHS